jgi:hypothetical protein
VGCCHHRRRRLRPTVLRRPGRPDAGEPRRHRDVLYVNCLSKTIARRSGWAGSRRHLRCCRQSSPNEPTSGSASPSPGSSSTSCERGITVPTSPTSRSATDLAGRRARRPPGDAGDIGVLDGSA